MRAVDLKNIRYAVGCRGLIVVACLVVCRTALSAEMSPEAPGALDVEEMYAHANELFRQGSHTEAEAEYKKLLETYKQYAPAHNNLGLIASLDERRLKEAVASFVTAAKIDPLYPDPFVNLAVICYKIGQYDQAKEYMKRVIQLVPDNSRHHFTLGWICLKKGGQHEEAIEHLEKAVELDERFAEAYYILGMAHIDRGRTVEVFDQVTNLRMLNREELANTLEGLIREPYDESTVTSSSSLSASPSRTSQVKMVYKIDGLEGGERARPAPAAPGRLSGSGTIQFRIQVMGKEQ